MIFESVPTSLRGELTRWFVEPKTGVFVGRVSAQVRDLVWEMACDKIKTGGALMLHSSNTEQGYAIKTHGDTSNELTSWEGLWLFRKPLSPKDKEVLMKEERANLRRDASVSRGIQEEPEG